MPTYLLSINQALNWNILVEFLLFFKIILQMFIKIMWKLVRLTHWDRVTHICVGNLGIIGSNNGLSPGRYQAIMWSSAGILLIGPLGTNFNEILIEICIFSFKELHLKLSSGHWRPFCLDLNVLRPCISGVYKTLYGNWSSSNIIIIHNNDVMTWGTVSHYRPFVRGTSQSPSAHRVIYNLNIKTVFLDTGKRAERPSCFYNGIPFTAKTASLHWNGILVHL